MKRKKIIKYSLISLVGVFSAFLIFFGGYSIVYAKKVLRSQYLGDTSLSGKSKDDLNNYLNERAKDFQSTSITLSYKNGDDEKEFAIKPEDIGLNYDISSTRDTIWNYGRAGKVYKNLTQQLLSLFKKKTYFFKYSIDESTLNKKIAEIAAQLDIPEKDFSISYANGNFVLNTDQQEGQRVNQEKMIEAIKVKLSKADKQNILFSTERFKPKVTENNARDTLKDANEILAKGDLTLVYSDKSFVADKDTIGGLIKSSVDGDDLILVLNDERATNFINLIATSINVDPTNTKLTVVDGKATIATPAVIGRALDQQQTKVDIGNSLFARVTGNSVNANPTQISLKVDTKAPEITDDAISTLGISELVGTGTTDYRSSPSNRVHNIQIGAAALNGVLLKPGETFSTLNKLGEINAESGYLPELVIKNNTTVPDFGGGLCQVSTTLFRATLNAGLKITERQNHSYRVSYYEPPIGMDASIFDPSPDFKFVNNYDHYILIQSYIKGTKITFDIYGTKDNRTIEISTPETYDVVEPGSPVMVETNTLPVGTKKQTDKAHQGITAKFSYKVTKDNNVLQSKVFVSKYTALPEKWLVGTGGAASSCSDGVQNGDETGTDCGGSCSNTCSAG